MPVTYDATTKNARLTATRDTVAGGDIQLLTSGDGVLVTFPLSATGGTVDAGVLTFSFGAGSTAGYTAAATGTGAAAKARIRDDGGTVRVSGLTVGTSGADVIVDNTSIAEDQDVTINSAEIEHAPDPA